MAHKNKFNYPLVIGIVVAFVIVAACVYFFSYHHAHNYPSRPQERFMMRNFTVNQTKVDETTSFFQNSPSTSQITTYCSQNRFYCLNYCRTNPNDSSCAGLFNYTGNYNYSYGMYPMMPYNGTSSNSGASQ